MASKRTKLADRKLPFYTHGEEIFNFVSHVVGGGLAVVMMVLCIVFASIHGNPWAIVTASIYGVSLVAVYTISSVYHVCGRRRPKRSSRSWITVPSTS